MTDDKQYSLTDENAIDIASAILLDSTIKYKKLLLSYKLSGDEALKSTYTSIEKWFLSDWGQTLSLGMGKTIIEQCQREVDEMVEEANYKQKTRRNRR